MQSLVVTVAVIQCSRQGRSRCRGDLHDSRSRSRACPPAWTGTGSSSDNPSNGFMNRERPGQACCMPQTRHASDQASLRPGMPQTRHASDQARLAACPASGEYTQHGTTLFTVSGLCTAKNASRACLKEPNGSRVSPGEDRCPLGADGARAGAWAGVTGSLRGRG